MKVPNYTTNVSAIARCATLKEIAFNNDTWEQRPDLQLDDHHLQRSVNEVPCFRYGAGPREPIFR